jgi:hypothetical protein
MRPAPQMSAGRLDSSRAGLFQTVEAALKSIRTWSFDRSRFAEANPIRSFLLTPKGRRNI